MSQRVKQVILIRRDLRLRRAEAAALVARASAEFFIDNDTSERDDVLAVRLTPVESQWLADGGTRIVVGVASEAALRSVVFKAEADGVACYTVSREAGDKRPDGDGAEVLCAALGPDESDKLDRITGGLKLF